MKQNKVPKNEYTHGEPSPYRKNPFKKDVLYTEEGQWRYPGQVTRIPGGDITMRGVDYPVYGEDDLGNAQMMYPGMDYTFPGQYVTEYPQMQIGGFIKKGLKAALKKIPTEQVKSVGKQVIGSLNPMAKVDIKKGNKWLKEWINDPATQAKIEKDYNKEKTIRKQKIAIQNAKVAKLERPLSEEHLKYLKNIQDKELDQIRATYDFSKAYNPDVRTYPIKKQLEDFNKGLENIHIDNSGVSYTHYFDPEDILNSKYMQMRKEGNPRIGEWVSRDLKMSPTKRTSTTIHEGTHGWVKDKTLKRLGHDELVKDALHPSVLEYYEKLYSPVKKHDLDWEESHLAYLGKPTEVHARVMQARKHFGLKPNHIVTPEEAGNMMSDIYYTKTPIDKDFARIFSDNQSAANVFNKLWAVPAVGAGVAGLQEQEYGGWLDELDEEFRRGGPTNPLMLTRGKRNKTSKNIQSSINKIFLRNHDIFGPGGKNIYDPKSKYEEGGDFLEEAQFGKFLKAGAKKLLPAVKTTVVKANVPSPSKMPSPEQLKDLHGFLPRRQFVKGLQKEELVGKDFNLADVNKAALTTDKTNKLTQAALDRQATRFRGVKGKVPKDGKGRDDVGNDWDMSKPTWNNKISEFENMRLKGVDFNDPLSIAKYQASHVPMQVYGYSSGLPESNTLGGLYASISPNNYGNYQVRMTSPRDYSAGNYKDWFNKYHNPKNNFDDLASTGTSGRRYHFDPVLPYDGPMAMYKGSNNVMGKRGSKMFDVDDSFPFMDVKNLSPQQKLDYQAYTQGLYNDYNTGWRGQYRPGGSLDYYQNAGSTGVKKPFVLSPQQIAQAQAIADNKKYEASLSKEDKLALLSQQPSGQPAHTLRKTEKQGLGSKADEVLMNPFTAATNLYKYKRLPDNFSQGPTNALDVAPQWINPAYYVEAAGRIGEAAFNPQTYKDLAKTAQTAGLYAMDQDLGDDWQEPLANTVGNVIDAGMARGAFKQLKKTLGKTINKKISSTTKNIKKGLAEDVKAYGKTAPTGKMEGMGTAEDIKRLSAKPTYKNNPYIFRDPHTNQPIYQTDPADFQNFKNSEMIDEAKKYYNNAANKWLNTEGLNRSGYTDVPNFYKQLERLKTQAQYGKRPLDKVTTPEGTHFNVSAALSGLDEARFEEGITDIIAKDFMKKAKPFKSKEAFQQISPNKYGGSPKGWLDNLT